QHRAIHRSGNQEGRGRRKNAGTKDQRHWALSGRRRHSALAVAPAYRARRCGPHSGILAAEGAQSFKVYNYITRAELKAVIDTAHKHGIKVTGHLCSIGFREAAELGIDDLEHGLTVDT